MLRFTIITLCLISATFRAEGGTYYYVLYSDNACQKSLGYRAVKSTDDEFCEYIFKANSYFAIERHSDAHILRHGKCDSTCSNCQSRVPIHMFAECMNTYLVNSDTNDHIYIRLDYTDNEIVSLTSFMDPDCHIQRGSVLRFDAGRCIHNLAVEPVNKDAYVSFDCDAQCIQCQHTSVHHDTCQQLQTSSGRNMYVRFQWDTRNTRGQFSSAHKCIHTCIHTLAIFVVLVYMFMV